MGLPVTPFEVTPKAPKVRTDVTACSKCLRHSHKFLAIVRKVHYNEDIGKDTRMQTANITDVDPHTRSAELQTKNALAY